MIYQIRQYIKFLLRSTNQHGVHSPFVYHLVTKCFYDKTKFQEYSNINNYRKALLKNKTKLNVTDLGAGSHITKNQTEIVAHIAKHLSPPKSRTKLLFRLVKYLDCKSILELGTSLGIVTQAMSLGAPKGHITTVEECQSISQFSRDNFKQHNLGSIEVINAHYSEIIQGLKLKTYDLVFFDGNLQKEATLNYFESLLGSAHNDTVFIFDGIYSSRSMTKAWEIITQHTKVTVSIDSFYWGFVFFRKEQHKEHFTIRV